MRTSNTSFRRNKVYTKANIFEFFGAIFHQACEHESDQLNKNKRSTMTIATMNPNGEILSGTLQETKQKTAIVILQSKMRLN